MPGVETPGRLAFSDMIAGLERQVADLNLQMQRLWAGPWVSPEGFNAKLEEHATLQVRTEGAATSARLHGIGKAKEEIAAGGTLFTLPAPYRPHETMRLGAININTGALSPVFVYSSGVVETRPAIPPGQFVAFDGLTFPLT